MAWQRIDPRYLKQTDRSTVALWYRDVGHLETGELLLWVDAAGRVQGFHLSHSDWPRGREHLAEWRDGHDLRLGEVDSGEGGGDAGSYKMSPTVRFLGRPEPHLLAELVAYFDRNAAALEPRHREAVAAVLHAGLEGDRAGEG